MFTTQLYRGIIRVFFRISDQFLDYGTLTRANLQNRKKNGTLTEDSTALKPNPGIKAINREI